MLEPINKEEFMRRVDELNDRQKKHFREMLEILVACYGPEPTMQALLLYKQVDVPASSVISANCNDMDATGMLLATTAYFEFINTQDAPPKEKFN